MARINVGHVAVGGVVAGIVINVISRAAWNFVLPNRMMAGSYLWGFVVGIIVVGLYSGFSARFGPSPARAVLAGMIAWFFAIGVPSYGFLAFETLSGSLVMLSLVLGVAEVVPAALAGALTYDWVAARQLARAQQQQPPNVSSVRLTPHTPLTVKAI